MGWFADIARPLAIAARVTARRLARGPLLPGWTWLYEVGTACLKAETAASAGAPVRPGRCGYTDAPLLPTWTVRGVTVKASNLGTRPALWFEPRRPRDGTVVLYLHGGAFAFYPGFCRTFHAVVARAARCRVVAPDYRLAPEWPFPAALDDAVSAYEGLLDAGVDHGHIVLMGDSAGGNLALAALLVLRDRGRPLPRLAVLLSPWVALQEEGDSLRLNAAYDWVTMDQGRAWAEWYASGHDARSPLISPMYADLRGLPPLYIQVGGAEVLRDQVRRFAEAACAQSVPAELEEWPHMVHVFQAFGRLAPQSRAALRRIADKMRG